MLFCDFLCQIATFDICFNTSKKEIIMFSYLIAEVSIVPIVVMVGLLVLLPLISFIPQRKRKKAAQEMMKSIRVGKKIRTIGGFVGEIVSLDEKNGTMELNVGTKEAPVIVNMYQGAIDIVLNPDVPVKEQNETKPEESETVTAVTADDAEQDAVQAEKAAEKKAKKDAKKKEKADKKAAEAEENAEETATEVEEVKSDELPH